MADTKITALTALTGADPANDVIPIVDVSDTTMAASGTTKKISVNNILGASGTATLASATITGDLTVDTSTLKVVSASDVVGINTTSPLTGNDAGLTIGAIGTVKALNIGLQNTFARLREKDAIDAFAITTNITASNTQDDATKSSWKARMGFGNGNDNFIISRSGVGSTTFYDLLAVSTGSCVWYDGAGGTRMTLNSTGLGVGVSPAVKVDIGGAATQQFRIQMSGQADTRVISDTGAGIIGTYSNHKLIIRTNSADAVTVDASQNVGIGVTPSAWRSGARALQLGANKYASLHEQSSGAVNLCFAAYEGSANVFNYTTGDAASRYALINGQHQWYNAPSGTAGNAITFTQAMTLDASGRLLVGKTSGVNSIETVGAGVDGRGTVTGVSTVATTIYTIKQSATAAMCVVFGDDGSNGFCDIVLFLATVAPKVVSSQTLYGSPAARTYSASTTNLQLALASGTLSIRTAALSTLNT